MRIVVVFCGIAGVAVTTATASEGLSYAALYYCQAEVVNRAVVRSCSAKFPTHTERAEKAFAKWSSQYGSKAQAAARKCEAEIERVSNAHERATMRANVDELKRKWLGEIDSRVELEGAAFCDRAISQLGSDRSRFEDSIWKLDDVTSNNAFERTEKHRGPRLTAARRLWPAAQRDR